MLGYEEAIVDASGNQIGWVETTPGCGQNVAALLIWKPKSCVKGATVQCVAQWIPYLGDVASTDQVLFDQNSTPVKSKVTYTGSYYKNTAIMDNYAAYADLPASLRSFPESAFARLVSGQPVTMKVDCPTGLPVVDSCALVPIA
jgi:hypothetical protein